MLDVLLDNNLLLTRIVATGCVVRQQLAADWNGFCWECSTSYSRNWKEEVRSKVPSLEKNSECRGNC